MTIELALTPQQDRTLSDLASALGVSRSEAAVRAIAFMADSLRHDAEVGRRAVSVLQQDASLLRRLAQGPATPSDGTREP